MITGALLWSALPRMWKLGVGVVVLIALVGAGLYIRHQIYHEGFRAAQEACERERRAQEAANNAAIRKAHEELMRAADKLSIRDMELTDALKQLDEASNADPDGHLCGLNARGVSRLQAIGNSANPSP